MKIALTALFVITVPFLSGQETEKSFILKNPLRIGDSALKNEMDSVALEKINTEFIERLIQSEYKSNKPIESDHIKDSLRMRAIFGSYAEFKQKFLALDIKNQVPNLNLPKMSGLSPYANDPLYAGRVGFAFSGPISFFYNKFSKEEQSRARYEALMQYEPNQRRINEKYNYEKVKLWTGLKGDCLTKFVLYCHFDDDYLLQANEYDLIETVMFKLIEFKSKKDSCNFDQ
jgi:hypothetical protein